MSADPRPQGFPAAVAWQAIDEVVNEIARLARGGLAADDFYSRFLKRVVDALAAAGGVIWFKNPAGRFEVKYLLDVGSIQLESHERLLLQASEERQPLIVPPSPASPSSGAPFNSTDFLLLLCPLKAEREVAAVVEIFQRPHGHAAPQQGYADFVRAACDLAEEFYLRNELDALRKSQQMSARWDEFIRAVYGSLDVQAAALTLVNDGRLIVGCDRLGVLLKHGSGCRVEAISGQHAINRRANIVRLLENLADAAWVLDEPLWHPGYGDQLPPQLEQTLQEYVDASYAKALAVLPLRPSLDDGSPGPAIGALIVEQFSGDRLCEPTKERALVVCAHGATALRNAQQYQSVFLLPLWQAIARSRWMVQARALPKTLTAAALILAIALSLFMVPADFEIRGPAELQPELRREVYARADGVVGDIRVEHGDEIPAGAVLAELRNTELDFQFTRVLGELQTTRKKLAAVRAARLEGAPVAAREREQYQSLTSEEEELKESLKSVEEQFQVLSQYKADLVVTSPIAGRVTTWNVAELLAARPVRRGQPLLAVADVSGPWILEIHLPDDQAGHVLAAQDRLGSDLDVSYILGTEPSATRLGKVKSMAMAVESDAAGVRSVLVRVKVDKASLPALRPGATATAKIHCGRRAIGYVWFRDLLEFVQSRVLF